ncbi:MAG TPA: retropepsin-like aspartic protease [Pyrinomonadaceae bacterium]
MLKLTLTALALAVVICVPRATARAAEESGEVPFSFEKGFVIVPAKIKGKGDVEVVISTGAEFSTVDGGATLKYKLQLYYTGVPPITGRNDRTISFSQVPDVQVGPAVESLSMRLGSTAHLSDAVGREIFGVLGNDFLKGRTVQFDFAKKVLRFLDKPAAEALRTKAAAAGAVLRMGEKENEFRQTLTLPLVEKVMFNDKPAKVLFDTGISTVIALSSSTAKKLGLETPPEKGNARTDTVKQLRLGTSELSDVPVTILAKGSKAEAQLGDGGALVGSVLLQNFVATFDYRGKVVILERF